jgi:undecaprenyl diphosphate synthase
MVVMAREHDGETLTLPRRLPRHVAIIMDGNGRWAKARGLPRTEGHRHGTENLRRIIRASVEFGIEILTIYAFSTENWRRPPLEVRLLMTILETVIDRELQELSDNGVQIRHIGRPDRIPPALLNKIRYACDFTKNNRRLILNVAFNYGGRDEIVHAVQEIIKAGIPADQVTEELMNHYMYTGDLPDPDLIIRTSGELRSSNFLVWQGAYSEFYFTPVCWPDFDREELLRALYEYDSRTRRFGKTDEQLEDSE